MQKPTENSTENRTNTMPYLDSTGDIVIPFDYDPGYHWWNGGQPISETINELKGE